MNNCGEADLAIAGSGTYNINYSTLANYWNLNSSMSAVGIFASNTWENDEGILESGLVTLNVKNSIIYGDTLDLVTLSSNSAGTPISARFDNTLLKLSSNSAFTPVGSDIIKNEDPKFQNYFTQKMNLRVKEGSPAIGKGKVADIVIPTDIAGKSRGNSPTIGAYQF